jgi:tellurite resistance protein
MKPLRAWSLPLVPASFFGIVLGLIGLGNPWRVAARLWRLPALAGELIMLAGVAVWAVVLVLYSAKWIFAREAALAELRHPIQCCFTGLAGVATMMVSMAAAPYSRVTAELLFLAGLAFTIGFGVWRTGGLWMGSRAAETITPVLYLPTVAGGFVAASAGTALGYTGTAQMAFGAAFFSWIAIESILLQRLFTAAPMEPALRPTLLIQLAPSTVGGVAAVNVLSDQWSILPGAMLGYGMLQALVLIRLMPWIAGKSFAPSYWGSAFGATAIAMLALRLAEREQPFAAALAPGLFVCANIAVAILAVGSLRLLVRGCLLGEPASAGAAPLSPAR